MHTQLKHCFVGRGEPYTHILQSGESGGKLNLAPDDEKVFVALLIQSAEKDPDGEYFVDANEKVGGGVVFRFFLDLDFRKDMVALPGPVLNLFITACTEVVNEAYQGDYSDDLTCCVVLQRPGSANTHIRLPNLYVEEETAIALMERIRARVRAQVGSKPDWAKDCLDKTIDAGPYSGTLRMPFCSKVRKRKPEEDNLDEFPGDERIVNEGKLYGVTGVFFQGEPDPEMTTAIHGSIEDMIQHCVLRLPEELSGTPGYVPIELDDPKDEESEEEEDVREDEERRVRGLKKKKKKKSGEEEEPEWFDVPVDDAVFNIILRLIISYRPKSGKPQPYKNAIIISLRMNHLTTPTMFFATTDSRFCLNLVTKEHSRQMTSFVFLRRSTKNVEDEHIFYPKCGCRCQNQTNGRKSGKPCPKYRAPHMTIPKGLVMDLFYSRIIMTKQKLRRIKRITTKYKRKDRTCASSYEDEEEEKKDIHTAPKRLLSGEDRWKRSRKKRRLQQSQRLIKHYTKIIESGGKYNRRFRPKRNKRNRRDWRKKQNDSDSDSD